MKKQLLFSFVALLCFGFANAQMVQTTHGFSYQSYIPIAMNHEYSYTQHIILKSELENGGWDSTYDVITKLRWEKFNSGYFSTAYNWKIYMGNISKTVFSSTDDWVDLGELTEVFDGTIPINTGFGWFEIVLDIPFWYDGVGNLVIAVAETTPGMSTQSVPFGSTNVGINRGLYRCQNDSIPSPDDPPSGILTSTVPNLQIYFHETCIAPNNVHLTAVSSTSATVAWSAGCQETSWNLEYREVGDTTWIPVMGLSATTCDLDSLNPGTHYQVRLQSDCGGNDLSLFTVPITFFTPPSPVQLPYFNDFEDSLTHSDFFFLHGTETNHWIISDAPGVNNTPNGAYAMYISNDPSTGTWAYSSDISSTSCVYAFCDVEVPDDAAELKLTFDWIAKGASMNYDLLRVYWMPISVGVVPGQNPPYTNGVNYDLQAQIGNYPGGLGQHWLSQQTTWQQAEFIINKTQFPNLSGNTWRLYFQWRYYSGMVDNPPATVDNISIQVVECATPSQLVVSNVTATTVDLEWVENGNAESWNVEYSKTNVTSWTLEVASTNPYTVENLDPLTSYQFKVRSDCVTGVSYYTLPVTQTTMCAPIANLPWEESFEAITAPNTLPQCWAATNLGSHIFIQTLNYGYHNRYAYTGTKAVNFTFDSNDYLYTPGFELQGGVSYDFSFWYITDGLSGWQSLQVGVFSHQTSASLIQQLAEITNVDDTTYQRLKVTFTPTDDGVYYFGVYCQSITPAWYLTVDDFMVYETPNCAVEPTNLTITNITSSSAEINFNPPLAGYLGFKVLWRDNEESTWEEEILYGTTSFLLTELTLNTVYKVRVYTQCIDSSYSDFVEVAFTTSCGEITLFPYIENFDTYLYGSFPTCWSFLRNYNVNLYCNSSYSVSPPHSLYVETVSSNGYVILIAPRVEESVDIQMLQVSFYARATNGQQVQLGVIEDTTLANTFVPLQTFTITESFQQYIGYLSGYTGTGRHVALKMAPTILTSYYFDDFVIDDMDCVPVSNLTVTDVGAVSAKVSWIPYGPFNSYNIEVIPAGYSSGLQFYTTENYYLLSGLTEFTDYTVWVTADCSGLQAPSISTTFTTTCALGDGVVIGTQEETTSTYGDYLPIYPYSGHSYTQQIFDATELSGMNDTIYGIGFQYFYGTGIWRNVEIYLGHTDQSSFSSTSNYVPGTHFVKVFDGVVNFTNSGENHWFMFNFTTPFVYDSESNLVVTVIDKTDHWVSFSGYIELFRTHATTGNKAIYYYTNDGQYSLNPIGGNYGVMSYRNNVKFITSCTALSCYPPDIIIDNIESHSVNFQFMPVLNENYWEVEYKPSEELDWISMGIVSTTIHTIYNLASYTQYDLRVRSLCGLSNMSPWRVTSFTTSFVPPATIPYSCNFEDPIENAEWSFKNSGQKNKWYVGNPSNNSNVNNTPGGGNALYISNDGGDTWAYSAGLGYKSKSYAFRDFEIPTGVSELCLTIDWIANGAGEADMLSLYWVSPDADIHAGMIPSGALSEDSALVTTYGAQVNDTRLYGVTDWQESTTFIINNTQFPNFAGKTWRLYFLWRNDITSAIAQQPPAAVDNITLKAVTCSTPSQLVATTATYNSVTLNWTETGNATNWNVEYKKSTESTWNVVQTSTKPFVINGLDHSSTYLIRVQANCGGGLSGYSNTVTKNTLCVPVTNLPWEDGFESITTAGEFPPCWLATGNIATLTTQIANYDSYNRKARSGTRAAYFTLGANNRLFTPGFQLQGGVSYDFSFYYVTGGLAYWITLQSGVYSSQSSTSPIQVLATQNSPSNANYVMMSGTFVPPASGVYYFGVYCQSTGNTGYLTLDDFAVYETNACETPTNLEVTHVTPYTIDLEWTEVGNATVWEVEYGTPGFISGTKVQVSTNSCTLTGLNHSTPYQIQVRAVCDTNNNSMWSPRVDIFTSCLSFELPYLEDFSFFPSCWSQTFSGSVPSNRWSHSPYTVHAGGATGEMKARDIQGVGVSRLISPLIRFENVEEAELSFKHTYYHYASGVLAKLQCSPDLETWTDLAFTHTGSTVYTTTVTVQFTPLADSLYFAWVIDGNHYNFSNWYVDDVSITKFCSSPTNLQVSNVTEYSAVASWTAGGAESSWLFGYKTVADTSWITQIVTAPFYIMSGLQPLTEYEVRVQSICESGESGYTGPVAFTTDAIVYTILASAGPNGTITPSGAVIVNQGESQIFTFTPEEGYRIDVVLVDDVPQVPVPESYMFEDIQADHTIHVDFAEGVNENELSKYVALYPNPTQYLIDLKIDRDYLGATECRIYNMYGKLLRVFPVEDEITTIDVSSFAAGIYFVRLTTEQGQVSKRFVKQ